MKLRAALTACVLSSACMMVPARYQHLITSYRTPSPRTLGIERFNVRAAVSGR
jgi:hypothetical protein